MLQLNKVTKKYRSGSEQVSAVKEVSFKIEPGDYAAIIGPSGAGKSTLMHLMGGLDFPSSGEVMFKGKNIYRMGDAVLSAWRNKTVGFVFQFFHLIEELNVLENITLACRDKRRKDALKTGRDLLEYFGVAQRQKFYPSQLSGGEKQKVAIARALANDPEFILCDEPTGNLDKDSQEKVMQLLERLHSQMNKAVVLVTHNHEVAARAGKILHMAAGQIEKVTENPGKQ